MRHETAAASAAGRPAGVTAAALSWRLALPAALQRGRLEEGQSFPTAQPTPERTRSATPTPETAETAVATARATTTALPTATGPIPRLEFDGRRAMAHAQAQCDLGPRPPGTAAHWQTGQMIADTLTGWGWEVTFDSFTYHGTELRNVVAKKGTGPVLMVAAHYDTRAVADRDPDPRAAGQPIVGANDGASGVAVLLELGRVLEDPGAAHQVWLTFFDAEDQGGIQGWEWYVGARHLAELIVRTKDLDFEALVLIDMVGDLNQQVCRMADSVEPLADAVFGTAARLGYSRWIRADCTAPYGGDDHVPFLERGLAAMAMVEADYFAYWHTHGDTCDKIGPVPLERVGRTLEMWLESGARWR